MATALGVDRLQFAFTIVYHYLFPQLTIGLALLIVVLKTVALRSDDPRYERAASFWVRIFAINFVMGVVTGIPMEFQFGTNWARFAERAGGVIGHPLAMEGVYAFFLESAFLGLLLFGEKRLSRRAHWLSAVAVFIGTWLSGFFIVATNAWMQHPVAYTLADDGSIALSSLLGVLLNPWLFWQYLHTMLAAVVTSCLVVAALSSLYLLGRRHQEVAKVCLRTAVLVGLPATVLVAFPTGDQHARMVAEHHGPSFAAMEGLFRTETGAPLVLIGQPDVESLHLDNPIEVPRALSFLTYKRWDAKVKGLTAFDRDLWPDNIPLLYFSYHIMVGLGTIFIAVMALATFLLWRGTLFEKRAMLWLLMLMAPFGYIANQAGWLTTELGRQPWLIWGLMRTDAGFSPGVSSGNAMFTLLGFMGLYTVLSILFIMLVWREIERGPEPLEEV